MVYKNTLFRVLTSFVIVLILISLVKYLFPRSVMGFTEKEENRKPDEGFFEYSSKEMANSSIGDGILTAIDIISKIGKVIVVIIIIIAIIGVLQWATTGKTTILSTVSFIASNDYSSPQVGLFANPLKRNNPLKPSSRYVSVFS